MASKKLKTCTIAESFQKEAERLKAKAFELLLEADALERNAKTAVHNHNCKQCNKATKHNVLVHPEKD